jgi:ATP-dependent Clp protease adapter protein ClpS
LSDAQWVIAREYGFPSWPALEVHIEQVSAGSTKVAPSYIVLMWNDNDTPMEFVCYLLKTIFEFDTEKAKQIMLDTHNRGVGVCGVYDRRQDAEAKIAAATTLAALLGSQDRERACQAAEESAAEGQTRAAGDLDDRDEG